MKTPIFAFILLLAILSNPFAYAGTISGKVEIPGKKDLSNTLVYIEKIKGTFNPPSGQPDMNHINLQFAPTNLVVMKGTTVEFPNSDPVFHSAFSISKSNPFDLGIYGQGREKFVSFKNPGLVEIFCHIHSHMHAFVMVTDHPFYAMTSKNGSYSISNIPDGIYSLNAWANPSVNGVKKVKVSGKASVNFTLNMEN